MPLVLMVPPVTVAVELPNPEVLTLRPPEKLPDETIWPFAIVTLTSELLAALSIWPTSPLDTVPLVVMLPPFIETVTEPRP